MKWYSVKKYRPPLQTICLLRASDNDLFLGYLRGLILPNNEITWVDYFDEDRIHNVEDVTHFCIPDAVEIDE